MIKTFSEMGFSVNGLHPSNSEGIYTNHGGFLHTKKHGRYIPLKPELGNSRHLGTRGAYFYFQADGQKYKVFQKEIQEFGLDAPAHQVTKDK